MTISPKAEIPWRDVGFCHRPKADSRRSKRKTRAYSILRAESFLTGKMRLSDLANKAGVIDHLGRNSYRVS